MKSCSCWLTLKADFARDPLFYSRRVINTSSGVWHRNYGDDADAQGWWKLGSVTPVHNTRACGGTRSLYTVCVCICTRVCVYHVIAVSISHLLIPVMISWNLRQLNLLIQSDRTFFNGALCFSILVICIESIKGSWAAPSISNALKNIFKESLEKRFKPHLKVVQIRLL